MDYVRDTPIGCLHVDILLLRVTYVGSLYMLPANIAYLNRQPKGCMLDSFQKIEVGRLPDDESGRRDRKVPTSRQKAGLTD
jgi:hypothetical protein